MPKDNEDSGAMAAQRPVRRTHQFWWIALLLVRFHRNAGVLRSGTSGGLSPRACSHLTM